MEIEIFCRLCPCCGRYEYVDSSHIDVSPIDVSPTDVDSSQVPCDSSQESMIIYSPGNVITKDKAEAAVKALVDYELTDENGNRLNPEGMEMTEFPAYHPECSDISEAEPENVEKLKILMEVKTLEILRWLWQTLL